MRAVVEPNPQPHIGMREDRRGDRAHAERRGGIAEEDRVEALCHRQRHARDRLAARGARAVIAPVGGRAVGIHQGEPEDPGLPRRDAVKIHAIDRHAPLVADDLRHLRPGEG